MKKLTEKQIEMINDAAWERVENFASHDNHENEMREELEKELGEEAFEELEDEIYDAYNKATIRELKNFFFEAE